MGAVQQLHDFIPGKETNKQEIRIKKQDSRSSPLPNSWVDSGISSHRLSLSFPSLFLSFSWFLILGS
jgi:hypothetical protein